MVMKRWLLAGLVLAVPLQAAQEGSKDATEYLYHFPWPAGKAYPVLAGNGEGSTHQGEFFYSWDFSMPVGDVVCAAREGTVLNIVDHAKSRRGIGIFILHDDGTGAMYGHLMRGGVLVKEGERVLQGEPIAKIGREAGGATPHLHFHISTMERLRTHQGAPVESNFRGPDGRPWKPRRGNTCMSENREPACLREIRILRRTKPLLEVAHRLGAFDLVLECVKRVRSVDPALGKRNEYIRKLLEEYQDLEAMEQLDRELLKRIEAVQPREAYRLAIFAMNEAKRSGLRGRFKAKVDALKEAVDPDVIRATRREAATRRLLIQAILQDLNETWTAAAASYERVMKKARDSELGRIAEKLRDLIVPEVWDR